MSIDFKNLTKFVTPKGVAIFPHLSEADTKFDSDGVYHTKLALETGAPATDKFIALLEPILEEFRNGEITVLKPADRKKAVTADIGEEELDDEGNPTGRTIFSFKLKSKFTSKKTGKTFEQSPRLFDSASPPQPLGADIDLWSGSEIRVSGEVVPYFMASTKTFGLSLRCKAVQVIKLVTGNGQSADAWGFEGEDGYVAPKAEANPFAGGESAPEEDDDEF